MSKKEIVIFILKLGIAQLAHVLAHVLLELLYKHIHAKKILTNLVGRLDCLCSRRRRRRGIGLCYRRSRSRSLVQVTGKALQFGVDGTHLLGKPHLQLLRAQLQRIILHEVAEEEYILVRQNLLRAEETQKHNLLATDLRILAQKVFLGLITRMRGRSRSSRHF